MQKTGNGLGYIAFIDGLRAISIIAVVGFHALIPGFSGGFVGVDVFFVISGYLIINQIRNDLQAGKFSVLNFYARRTLRILPIYILVLVVTYLGAIAFIIVPNLYEDFARSAVLAPLMATNILFYLRQGYFDPNAIDRPLLHTWTLSVEEQFYLVAPALLVLVFLAGSQRFGRMAFVAASGLALASLIGSVLLTDPDGRNSAFYLPHLRAWEFIAGGLTVHRVSAAIGKAPRFLAESLGWAGLLLILFAIARFDDTMAYPSWRALVPVVGTVLIIYSGTGNSSTNLVRLLSMRPMVLVGLISYGWYLWHWPVLTYLRMLQTDEPALAIDIAGALLAALLAVLSYRQVEVPVRRWRIENRHSLRSGRIFFLGVCACFATAGAGGLISLGGYLYTGNTLNAQYDMDGRGDFTSECRILTSSSLPPGCLDSDYGLLIGDSHADALYGALARELDKRGVKLVSIARGGCNPVWFAPRQRAWNPDHRCKNLIGALETALVHPEPPGFVIITSRIFDYNEADLDDLVTQFDPKRTRVLLIGPVPVFKKPAIECVVLNDRFSGNRVACTALRVDQEKARAKSVETLHAVADRYDQVRYIDPIDTFCSEATCYPYGDNRVFYRDSHHVTTAGADRIWDDFTADFEWAIANSSTAVGRP